MAKRQIDLRTDTPFEKALEPLVKKPKTQYPTRSRTSPKQKPKLFITPPVLEATEGYREERPLKIPWSEFVARVKAGRTPT